MNAHQTREIDAVLFDYGGVLTSPVRHSIAAWIAEDGIDAASFSATLKAWLGRSADDGTPIHGLETGELSAEEFERVFADALRTVDGSEVRAAGILSRLFAEMRPDEAMFALTEELRGLGIRVGLLSNSWGNTYPRGRIDALFDPVVISSEVGLRKPHPEIYDLALERLGIPASRALFIDDAEPNVFGAEKVGMRALLHHDSASTRLALAGLIPGLTHSSPGATA